MFQVGKSYEFRMIEGGDDVTFSGIVERYEHPLLKLEDATFSGALGPSGTTKSMTEKGRIINVTSASFVGAVER